MGSGNKMKREFAVGDHIRVYASSTPMYSITTPYIGPKEGEQCGSFKAKVEEINFYAYASEEYLLVSHLRPGRHFGLEKKRLIVHPKQCRHLKKKPARKAREWWLITNRGAPLNVYVWDHHPGKGVESILDECQKIIHVREVLPTKKLRPITREMIEKAWRIGPRCEMPGLHGFIEELEKIGGRRFR